MKKRFLLGSLLLSLLSMVLPSASFAEINCSTAKPNMSIKSSDSVYSSEENAQVVISLDTNSCFSRNPGQTKYTFEENCLCFNDSIVREQWIYAVSGNNMYWFQVGKGWKYSDITEPIVATEGPLVSVQNFPIFNSADIPNGTYTFTYAIDNDNNHIPDKTFSTQATIKIDGNNPEKECRSCHEGRPFSRYSSFDNTTIPARHHKLVNEMGFSCRECHGVIYQPDGSGQLETMRDCPYCHSQPNQFIISKLRAIPKESLTERHHRKYTATMGCNICHRNNSTTQEQ